MSGYSKDSILVLRINLDDTKIWRRLEVPASSTLRDIHALMMVAVGWVVGNLPVTLQHASARKIHSPGAFQDVA